MSGPVRRHRQIFLANETDIAFSCSNRDQFFWNSDFLYFGVELQISDAGPFFSEKIILIYSDAKLKARSEASRQKIVFSSKFEPQIYYLLQFADFYSK